MALTKVEAEQLQAAQTSITSVGTLTGLTISGDLTVDTSTLIVDSSNNRVGIGTASPNTNLQLYHATDDISINVSHGTGGSYPKKSGISFGATSTSLGGDATFTGGAGIQVTNTAATNNPTEMAFFTTSGGAPTTRMLINSGGDVFISTTNANPHTLSSGGGTKFFNNVGSLLAIARDSQTVIAANRSGSSAGTVMDFRMDGTIKGTLGVSSSGFVINESGGNVGIGTTGPESGLHLYDGTNVGSPQNANRRGTLIIEAGSEGSADIQLLNASYSHIFFGDAADPNTGMIWYQHAAGGSGADSLHFGTAGKADDITIKSNGFVGIGESNPARRLSVRRDTGITAGFNDISQFLDTTVGAGGSVSLNLGKANSTKNLGKMAFKYAGSGSNSNALNFGFYDADNLMTLTAGGNVGIGTTDPEGRLMVEVTGANATPPVKINRGLDGGRIQMQYGSNETGVGEIGQMYAGTGRTQIWIGANLNSFSTAHSSSPVQNDANYASWFSDWDSYRDRFTVSRIASGSTSNLLKVSSNGDVDIVDGDLKFAAGHGISFINAADTALGETVSSSVLDDYEEGSWTPGIGGYSGGACTMGSANMGRYVRIGQQVTVNATVHIASVPTLSGSIVLTGLPFLTLNQSNYRSNASPVTNTAITPGSGMTMLGIGVDANYRFAWIVGMNPTTKTYTHTPTVGTGFLYGFAMTYMTNS